MPSTSSTSSTTSSSTSTVGAPPRPVPRWVQVRDAQGRPRLEMRWIVPDHGQLILAA